MRWREQIIVAKTENPYGADAAPVGANAMLVRNVNLTPLAAETIERDNLRPESGAYQQIHVGAHVLLEFDVEMAGAGSAGGIPAYDVLMRACALAETNIVGVSAQYDPVSENEESCTLYMYFADQQHKLIGSRGVWSVKMDKKGIPYWHFAMTGLWADPSSVVSVVPDFSGFVAPKHVSNDNTPTCQLFGRNLICSSLEISSGNEVIHRDLIGVEEVVVVDRKITGKIKFEDVPLSVWNVYTVAKA